MGKKRGDLPIETLPSMFMFDWNELKRWHIPESRLPSGSIILFREPKSLGAHQMGLGHCISDHTSSFRFGRLSATQPKTVEIGQREQRQLSGMLINAEEQERPG